MAVVRDEREVKPYEPNPLGRIWMRRLDPPVRKVAEAAYNAIKHVGADSVKRQLKEALKGLEYNGSLGDWGTDAVRRGRAGEALSAADFSMVCAAGKSLARADPACIALLTSATNVW